MPLIGDFNGDGKDDLVVWYPQNGDWHVALSEAIKFVPAPGPVGSPWISNWAPGTGWIPLAGDFNGDDTADLVVWHPSNGDWQVALSDRTRFSGVGGSWLSNWPPSTDWVPLVGDFNGGGTDDLVVWHPSNGDWQVALSDGTRFNPVGGSWLSNWAPSTDWVPLVGDFNGDGKDDLVVWHPSNGDWQVALSDGTRFNPVGGSWLLNWAQGTGWKAFVGDFNGDGKDDIAVWHPENGDWQVALSDGTRFVTTQGAGGGSWLMHWPQGPGWKAFVGDFNGDGKDDIAVWHSQNGDWHVALSEGTRFISRTPRSLLARRPGFSDLYIVRDEWASYEPGELAHIENVMASEVRERSHTRVTENEETFTTDEERSKLDERDTQSTDRFDLHTETSRDSSLNVGVDGSVDTSGQYGPTAVTTHLGGNLDYSLNESQSQATTTAHEIVARAVVRVEEKVRQVRTTRSLSRIEEVNKHAFTNNKENAKHIVGIYRWVDKIKWVQIFRYPNRFLLEFQIPEPGAWLRWLLHQKKKPTTAENPPALTVKNTDANGSESVVDLTPAILDANNYLAIAARYKTLGLKPPPEMKVANISFNEDTIHPRTDDEIKKRGQIRFFKLGEIKVPTGYVARKWYALVHGWYEDKFGGGDASILLTVGNFDDHYIAQNQTEEFNYFVPPKPISASTNADGSWSLYPDIDESLIPVSIRLNKLQGFNIHITVECEPSEAELMKWRIETYGLIAQAYYAMKRVYDEELAAQDIRAGVEIKGQSPLQNAEMARVEIKKAVIEMLTAEDFTGRSAIQPRLDVDNKPVPPEIDLDKVLQTAPEIQFIEQAFEWENMTYVLYPYFWTGKDQWDQLADLNSEDPDFARFLRAGSARVIVPARPGFECQSWLYVYAGIIWGGGPAPGPEDEDYLSIIDEIEAQQKPPRDGTPGESWEVRLPTTLVWLDNVSSSLPVIQPDSEHELDAPPGRALANP